MARRLPDPTRIEVVDEAIARILRAKSPVEKLQMAFDANRTMRLIIEGAVRTDHPEWSDAEVNVEVVRRIIRATV